jgi:hypothetical protein
MWNDTWGWRQACAIVAALGVVGIVLQIAVGHIPQGAFVFPQNIIWGSAFLLAIVVSYVLLGRYNKQVQFFFSGTVATLSSIGIGSVAHNGFHQADTRRNGSRTYASVAQNRV